MASRADGARAASARRRGRCRLPPRASGLSGAASGYIRRGSRRTARRSTVRPGKAQGRQPHEPGTCRGSGRASRAATSGGVLRGVAARHARSSATAGRWLGLIGLPASCPRPRQECPLVPLRCRSPSLLPAPVAVVPLRPPAPWPGRRRCGKGEPPAAAPCRGPCLRTGGRAQALVVPGLPNPPGARGRTHRRGARRRALVRARHLGP